MTQFIIAVIVLGFLIELLDKQSSKVAWLVVIMLLTSIAVFKPSSITMLNGLLYRPQGRVRPTS